MWYNFKHERNCSLGTFDDYSSRRRNRYPSEHLIVEQYSTRSSAAHNTLRIFNAHWTAQSSFCQVYGYKYTNVGHMHDARRGESQPGVNWKINHLVDQRTVYQR